MITVSYDVVVIGGGIHGAGVAQAAAAAGFSTLLLERKAIGSGTSSRSSKLIHGGLRYLESAQFGLVRESLREREILLKIAPELVQPVSFFIPVYTFTQRRPLTIRAGLTLYALLGGLSRGARFETIPYAQWNELDGLDTRELQQVFRYEDAHTDDALLTLAVVRSAQRLGAVLHCPADFQSANQDGNGYKVCYLRNDNEFTCHARTLVNSAGPWVNLILERVMPQPSILPVDLVQGAHIIVEGKTSRGVYYLEAPSDRRAVFVMPWQGQTLVGTTETSFEGNPGEVRPHPGEIDYLQEIVVRYFPDRHSRLLDSFAGLRVLPHKPGPVFHRSRETVLHPDDPKQVRLITIYGGKLTGYRATAVKVINLLKKSLSARAPIADTANVKLLP